MVDIPCALKEASSASLLSLLKSIDGQKDLVLDSELIWSLDYIAKVQQLKACNVEKIFRLEPGSSPGNSSRCVYLIRSTMESSKVIADHINANRHSSIHKNYWVIFVPRRLYTCDLVLEREGVYGFVKILEFPLGLIPVDSDMLSLELTDFFPSFFLNGDQTHLYTAALSIVQLQKLCGSISKVYGQGKCANMVFDMVKIIMSGTERLPQENSCITDLIVFDRDVDFVSVLLTQLNYEGILDETFDIKSGRASFVKEATGQDQVLKLVLNDEDVIYREIRNCHFTSVLGILKEKAKQLQTKHDSTKMSLEDMKRIVAHKMKTAQQERLLPIYIYTCEVIIKQKNEGDFQDQLTTESNLIEGRMLKECHSFIEETINRQAPLCCSLRLLCLLSVTQDGLAAKDYNFFTTQFLQSYGHKHMLTLQNLKKMHLFNEVASTYKHLQPQISMTPAGATASKLVGKVAAAVAFPRQSTFQSIAKKFQLVPGTDTDINLRNPSDMSYVFSGTYVPIISKLVEQAISNEGLTKFEDALKLLPGPTVQYEFPVMQVASGSQNSVKRIVIVYFLGGVTYAEVSALRLLGKTKGVKIVIATTAIINGNSLLKLLMPTESC